jgi:hypothetical protein
MTPPSAAPSKVTAWWRAVRGRCPVCGHGHLFRHWFGMVERCPGCGLRFERSEGSWTGSVGLNIVVTFTLLFLTLIGVFLLTYPDVPIATMGLLGAAVAVGFPIAFFPLSKTIWLTIELTLNPLEPGEARLIPGSGGETGETGPAERPEPR